jgi:hypothetical protein
MILTADDPARLLSSFAAYRPPEADMARWALDLTNS